MKTNDSPRQTKGLNPFLPFDVYVPDGEPKVFGDRVYLYGSYDRFGGGYCSKIYHAFSAPISDLTDWTDHGESFSTNAVPWSDADLYAPDALYHNGKYYLFFCLSDGSEGVAESASPAGPFANARRITMNGEPIRGIDPSVLEDGGKVYYTWGQFRLHIAELDADLCTLRPETYHTDVITNLDGAEGFHEGSSLRKLGDAYCLIYASEFTPGFPHHGGRPTKLDYALSDSPYGPYTRKGTVIDNEGCDPASWNNHGSVIRIGDEWYVFYHASSNNTAYSRRARAEKLEVEAEQGLIHTARPTTNGFVPTLLPSMITSPVNACRFFGGAYVTETPDGRFPAVGLRSGAGFSFSPVVFEAGRYALMVRVRAFKNAVLRLNLDETPVAEIPLHGAAALTPVSLSFAVPGGQFSVRLTVEGAPDLDLCEIDTLKIERIIEADRV